MLPAWLLCIEQAQGAYTLRKDAKTAILAGSARTIPGPLCFTPGVCSHRFTFSAACMPLLKTAPDLFLLRRAAWLPVSFLHGTLPPLP